MNTALDTATEAIVAAVHEEVKELLGELAQAERLSLAEAEEKVLAFVRCFGRGLLERALAVRGSGNEGSRRQCSCGAWQKHQGKRWRRVVTLLGEVRMGRAYYQCPHCHRTAVPLDEQLGLGRGQLSWGLQQAVGQLSAALAFEPAMEMLEELTGVRVCAKTAQVVSEALGKEVLQAQQQEVEGAFTGEAEPEAEGAPERLYAALEGTPVRTEEGWKEGKLAAVYEPEDEVQAVVEAWREEYNNERPHSSLGYLTPAEFAEGHRAVERSVGFRLRRPKCGRLRPTKAGRATPSLRPQSEGEAVILSLQVDQETGASHMQSLNRER